MTQEPRQIIKMIEIRRIKLLEHVMRHKKFVINYGGGRLLGKVE